MKMGAISCVLPGNNSLLASANLPNGRMLSRKISLSKVSSLANVVHLSLLPIYSFPTFGPRRTRKVAVRILLDDSSIQEQAPLEPKTVDSVFSTASSEMKAGETVTASGDARFVGTQKQITDRERRREAERSTYLWAAIASTVGVTFLAAGAVYYRFAWQMQGGEVSAAEMFGTFTLAVGAVVGMEFWARWAHRALWHGSLWNMHKSHHLPRDGPFELNDVFAIINAVPAMLLLAYGFFHKGFVPGLCFGTGLGITVFGMAYMFVHDGLVHRRFPVGPIANVPHLQKVAAAHQLHHADKFNGVPFGLFLGPKEVEEAGGLEELQKLVQRRRGN
eukprot:c20187_g1_i1 orf=602-1600(-)